MAIATSRGKKGRGDHGLYPSLIARWMGCDHCHSLSLPEGSRGGVTMASDLLFLEGGGSLLGKWRSVIIVTPFHFQRDPLFLEGGGVWP